MFTAVMASRTAAVPIDHWLNVFCQRAEGSSSRAAAADVEVLELKAFAIVEEFGLAMNQLTPLVKFANSVNGRSLLRAVASAVARRSAL